MRKILFIICLALTFNSNANTLRCYCVDGKISVAKWPDYNVSCWTESGTTLKRTIIYSFPKTNVPTIFVEPLETKPANTQGCELINQ
jgi:hypothetical protein